MRQRNIREADPSPEFAGPQAARRQARQLHRALGVAPVIAQVNPAVWRLTLKSERVELVIDYRARAGGKARWAASTLKVDGRPRPLAAGFDDFVQIWRSHPAGPAREAAPAVLIDVPAADPAVPMPTAVQAVIRQLTDSLARAGDIPGMTVEAGRAGNRWIIGLTMPCGGLRLVLAQHGKAREWHIHWPHSQVIADGKDVSREAHNDLAAAVALLSPAPQEGAPGTGPVAAAAPAAASNAVRERRHSAIRN
jgi:hypothetical protein